MTVPDRENFFVLRPARDSDRAFAWTDDVGTKWDEEMCPLFGSLAKRRLTPLSIQGRPKIGDDFIWTWYHDVLATSTGMARLRERGITGCEFAEVLVARQGAEDHRQLWELRVTGFAGFARPATLSVLERCCEHEAFSYSITSPFHELLDLQKLDGADLFIVWPFPLIRICTPRLADALRSDALAGIKLAPIRDFKLAGATAAPGIPSASLAEPARRRLEADVDYRRFVHEACGAPPN